jgi:hypothetical protein
VPAAIKLQAEIGEDLQVIFVESQGATATKAEKFALDRKWLGGRAMWTTEPPFNTGLGGLPSCALVSPTGEILEVGMSGSVMGDVEDHIAAFAKSKKKFPKDLPKDLKKAWTANAKGDIAKALELLTPLEEGSTDISFAAGDLRRAINKKVESRFKAITWMTTNGFPLEALAQLETLAENVEEHEEFTKRAADMVANLEGDDMKAEMDAAKAMAKIEKAIVKSGPDEKIAKKLNKLAKTHSGTKVATRAKTLADLILS